jgi:hypothetical protein
MYPLWGWLSDPCRLFPAAGLWSSDETDEDWPSGFVFAPVGVELQDSTPADSTRKKGRTRRGADWSINRGFMISPKDFRAAGRITPSAPFACES